ncbi:MAG: ATP-binding protein [Chloroflexota bacterium]|nr:MAG: ATP-binding protein [Chloroflexota bacterium]
MNVDTTGRTLSLPTDAQLESAIVESVVKALRDWVGQAQPGLCGRLDDLPVAMMSRVAENLYLEFDGPESKANVRLLTADTPTAAWECQWTEAVRLRNPDENGRKRLPLLLLVPPGTELLGSLDADTFQAIPCGDMVRRLVDEQISQLPEEMSAVAELLRRRDLVRDTRDTQRAKYLLMLADNGHSTEAAGLGLCLLGLWPHRTWLVDESNREYWLTRNQKLVSDLRHGNSSLLSRVYAQNLETPEQAHSLYELIASSPDVSAAAERVVTDPAWTDLEFGQLRFVEQLETVVINVEPLGLPKQEDGYQVLKVKDQPHLPLVWTTSPGPAHVPRLTHYLVEFVSTNGDVVDVVCATSAIPPTKSARRSYTVKNVRALVQSDPAQLPEGLYRVRVTAWVGATNITRQPAAQQEPSNLSEYFWVLNEGEDLPAPPVRKETYVPSYMHARRELQWEALATNRDPWSIPEAAIAWDGPADGRTVQGACSIQLGRRKFRIRLSNLLRRLEMRILAKPGSLGALQVELSSGIAPREVHPSERTADVPRLADDDPFLSARARLFAKMRGNDNSGTIETQDLIGLREDILEYVRQYVNLLRHAESDVTREPKKWPERVGLVTIDTIRVTLPGLSENTSIALLLAPTHPLRMLWTLQLALIGDAWLRKLQSQTGTRGLGTDAMAALRSELQPVNVPPVMYDRKRVGYLQSGAVAAGWDAYLPADIADKRSAMSRLAHALSTGSGDTISEARSGELTDRIVRYIWQHPYVSQLQLNVFNPGDGAIIVDLLSRLDKIYPKMRYDVRLFTHDDVRDDLGSALDELVNPDGPVESSAEKYVQSGRFPLHPNLRYSKNRVEEFLAEPSRFEAHLSILLDIFRPRIDVHEPFSSRSGSKLYGLVHESVERSLGEQGKFAWERQVLPGSVAEVEAGAGEAALLCEALTAAQSFVAALGTSPISREGRVPTVRLDLSVDGQNLLYEIHQVSDWVLTIDRHLGIDYFDSSAEQSAAGAILLDFAPEFPATDRAVLMLTTRVNEEIDRLVTPVMQRLGLDEPGSSRRVVNWLRSLSGRLAMRLISAPLDSQGVVGMALARAFLDQNQILTDSVIIPVDAHIRLLNMGLPEDATKSRTDLIIARRVGASRQIEFSLVEVKCRSGAMPLSAYHALREEMVGQVNQTQTALATLFDQSTQPDDIVDRPLRNQTLARWLRFYVGRARRYELLSEEGQAGFLGLIEDLDDGYTVSFRQSGLVFELGREDDVEDTSGDMPIYRVGRESCRRLIRGGVDSTPVPPTWDRARRTIRGGEVWTRPASPSDIAGADEPSATSVQEVKTSSHDSDGISSTGTESRISTEQEKESTNQADAVTAREGDLDEEDLQDGTEDRIPNCHYLVGDTKLTPQWGILGKYGGDSVALDLNGCNTLSLFGVQGGGKSYTMGAILEMALRKLPGLNILPHPLAAVVFHYNESQDYAPEFVSMNHPNRVVSEVARLRGEYGGEPSSVEDVLVLAPSDKVAARQRDFPGLSVQPIAFHPAELTIQDWRFLMGAIGNDSLYIRELNLVMRSLRENITIDGLRQAIDASTLSDTQKRLAGLRLRFAEQFVREGDRLRDKLYPGRLVVVDLRDELIETDEALGLFVVMLRVFAGATYNGKPFSKWIAFDEAHKYIRNSDLVDSVVEVIRQMRHQATSVLIASQDPPSLPIKIVELSSMVMLHRMDSPGWLKHIQRAITALGELTPPSLARLSPGEAYVWARMATDPVFTRRAVKIECRPRATQHGGATLQATEH